MMMMNIDQLYQGFRRPPRSCTQIPFWFLNGEVDGHEYARQIEDMASQGVLQAMPHPRYGMDRRDYLTERFWSAMEQLLRKASETGFTIHLYDEFNWSSGPAGGRVTAHVPYRSLGISIRARTVTGPARVTFDDCDDRPLRIDMLTNFSQREDYLRVLLVPLTDDDTLDFQAATELPVPLSEKTEVVIEVPSGKFEAIVLFTVRSSHPSPIAPGCGGLIDYLSPEPTRRFIEHTHEEYAKRFGRYFGSTIKSIFYDESGPFSAGCFTWTDRFAEEFERLKGYDIVANLHHLFYDAGATTEKVRCDYWDVVAHLFTESFIGQLADWCGEHGIALTGHAFEEIHRWTWAADPYRLLRRQQWPGTDSLGGYKNYSEIKLAQGVSHISGKRVLACESIGGMDAWAATLRTTRKAYNQLAVAGVTHTIPHAFFQSVESAKSECPPSFFFQNPFWKYYRRLADMTARQNWINRQGVHVADIAVFYPLVSWWGDARGGRGLGLPQAHASGVYNPKGASTPEDPITFNSIIDTLMGNQLDHDVIDSQGLAEATIGDGTIAVAGERFRCLVVPPMNTIRASDVARFRELVDAGGILVVVGRWPSISMERGRDDADLTAAVRELRSRAHTVADAEALVTLLRRLIEPDIAVTEGDTDAIDACHRRITDDSGSSTEVYLISNTRPTETTVSLTLRATGQVAIWNSETGEAFRGAGKRIGDGTAVTLRLGPYAAPYVMIGEKVADGLPPLPVETTGEPAATIPVTGTWLFKPLPGEEPISAPTPTCRSSCRCRCSAPPRSTTRIPCASSRRSGSGSPTLSSTTRAGTWCTARAGPCSTTTGTAAASSAPSFRRGRTPSSCPSRSTASTCCTSTAPACGWRGNAPSWSRAGSTSLPGRQAGRAGGGVPLDGGPVRHHRPLRVPLPSAGGGAGILGRPGLWWYSGYAQYDKEVELPDPAGRKLILDLGEVRESVELWVNARCVGARIWPPYSFDITRYVVPGRNDIRVIASNLLANHMFWAEAGRRDKPGKVCPSGLLGPVRIDVFDDRHVSGDRATHEEAS